MSRTDQERLRRLGQGDSIRAICKDDGLTRSEFDQWWTDRTRALVPSMDGVRSAHGLQAQIDILRDEWGVPHVLAETDDDLFFGYGYATAQDRLWQLDYFRRKAHGRLSEILGAEGVDTDTIFRTIGITRTSESNFRRFSPSTKRRLGAYADGVTAFMDECKGSLPIEFDLLDYEPDAWSPVDSAAIWQEFRWYLTGRLPIIAIPELAKRVLGKGPLLDAFITGEAEDESIVPTGSYPSARMGAEAVGEVVGDPDEGVGSNNWVVAAQKSASGAPIVASDPHIAFGAVSCWFEIHLSGPSLNAAGAGYVGVPGIIFGRNETLAWGVTNNICSQRDIYQEREHPNRPGFFRFGNEWRESKHATEKIEVRGQESREITVQTTHNGPLIDSLLPQPLRTDDKVSVKWLGAAFGDEITCMLDLAAARDCAGAREALRGWVVPTWSYVFGDVDGHIGYQAVGRIPVRERWNREYRPGWEPEHQWRGFIPYDALPALRDPADGYARSANNRGAPEDFPYPLSGTWSSGYRARRIRELLEGAERLSREDFARIQTDTLSMRAVDALPSLLGIIEQASDPRVQEAANHLRAWNARMDVDQVGASIFESFFAAWTKAIASERFHGEEIPLVAGAVSGFAVRLLAGDEFGYFRSTNLEQAVMDCMSEAISELDDRLGPDMSHWQWGNIHKIALNHFLSNRGDLSSLLSRGGQPVGGNGITICNTGFDPNYLASIGANWRHNADLGDDPPGIWAVDASGQSGHPGSPHYGDQLPEWLAGRHHYIPLDRERSRAGAKQILNLRPASNAV